MSLFVQHGYGKSDKIERGIANGHINGVIMSPRDETPDNMGTYISTIRTNYPGVSIFMDPQFYASTITPVRDGHLPDYQYYRSGLTRGSFIAPTNIISYVRETIDYQVSLNVTRILSPTVLVDDFRDPWSQISLTMAIESQQYHSSLRNAPPLLVSISFNENALRNIDALNEYLDMISLSEAQGFYIVVRRNSNEFSPQIEPILLENLMYMSYILAQVNEFEVIFGYCDFLSIPLHATGITASACGWYNSLKQFTLSRFQPSTGGRSPRPRYTSQNLMNSILLIPELSTINQMGRLRDVLSNTLYDRPVGINPANAPWPPDISCLHHWEVLNRIISNVVAQPNCSLKLDFVTGLVEQSRLLYNGLLRTGMVFENNSGESHLGQWRNSITNFRSKAGV